MRVRQSARVRRGMEVRGQLAGRLFLEGVARGRFLAENAAGSSGAQNLRSGCAGRAAATVGGSCNQRLRSRLRKAASDESSAFEQEREMYAR